MMIFDGGHHAVLVQHSASPLEMAITIYLRAEFATETKELDDWALNDLVYHAMQDGDRLEDTRPGTIATLAVLHVLRPDLMHDRFVWAQVMGENPEGQNPLQRIGLLSAYHSTDLLSVKALDAYHAKLGQFWGYFEE